MARQMAFELREKRSRVMVLAQHITLKENESGRWIVSFRGLCVTWLWLEEDSVAAD